ncbi:hypothetical protein [Allomuricauda sp. SCSIO 65647]|uniref:hypothetical protein n=1 Tax=Allomuricauda sp. SCSIO 65647 TaxID=2908843 RepID=UPI001F2679AE|nr:hypothetical protein [Muricauda sp. SCSIO 65647]UJH66713.1 hypothetical protein L0P89_12170 [Muricauda sp. SCSIO 65647]
MISVITYKKYFDTPLKFFPIYIAYVIFTELLGYFIMNYEEFSFFSEQKYSWHNIVIYNIYQIIMLCFFYWVYFTLLRNAKHKKYMAIVVTITALAYLINLFFENPLHSSLYYADFVGSYSLVFCIVLYYKEKMNEGKPSTLKENLMFWVSLGLLIFHIFAPILFFVGYQDFEMWNKYHFRKVIWVLVSLMYTLFSIGLIISKRKAFR